MGALPNYKEIVELIKKGSTVEAQGKIMELREATVDLKVESSNFLQAIFRSLVLHYPVLGQFLLDKFQSLEC